MKRSGAWLAVRALENIGVKYTFGIPGVHNTEIYDQLNRSEQITPILVTHEQGASFMGEAFSRVSDSIGCLMVVPAAGMTHAMSGIGEAYLDGIPLLVISGGIRRDSGRYFQLHQLDQQRVLDGITKAAFLVDEHEDVVPTIYKAYEIATSGLPGPVFVEIAGNVQMFTADVDEVPKFVPTYRPPAPDPPLVERAVALLRSARQPGMYPGWGAREATRWSAEVAELLGAPVSTTMQGISVFPHDHPLHAGFGFGPSAVPAARKAFEGVDCLLAVGVRFAELATGSYGMPIPETLIHADIDPEVFSKNYPATVAIESDGELFMKALLEALRKTGVTPPDRGDLKKQIKHEKEAFFASWTSKINEERVSPGIFFRQLRKKRELAQISQFQSIPLKDKTCTITGDLQVEGVAIATGAAYVKMDNDREVDRALDEALKIAATGRPVIVDVNIDYSRKSVFTQGVVKVNLGRFPLSQKVRYIGRALKRHTIG